MQNKKFFMIDIVNVIYVLQIEQLYKKEVKILCHM